MRHGIGPWEKRNDRVEAAPAKSLANVGWVARGVAEKPAPCGMVPCIVPCMLSYLALIRDRIYYFGG